MSNLGRQKQVQPGLNPFSICFCSHDSNYHVMPSRHLPTLYINNSVTDPHSGMWCMTGPALYFVQLGEGTCEATRTCGNALGTAHLIMPLRAVSPRCTE